MFLILLRIVDRRIGDGFGNFWPMYCKTCGRKTQIVRPGKAQCPAGHDLWTR